MKTIEEILADTSLRDVTLGVDGLKGYVRMPLPKRPPLSARILKVIASRGMGWDHVSVSLPERTPNYEEMDFVRFVFWNPDETVMQLHVSVSDHVNMASTCLHLWRPQNVEIPRPPKIMVGW